MTQHHVRMQNDVWTGCIGATLSIVKLLATPSHLVSSRPRQFSEGNRGRKRRWVAFCHQEPHLQKVLASMGPGQGARQLVERADGKFENHAGGQGMGESRFLLP